MGAVGINFFRRVYAIGSIDRVNSKTVQNLCDVEKSQNERVEKSVFKCYGDVVKINEVV